MPREGKFRFITTWVLTFVVLDIVSFSYDILFTKIIAEIWEQRNYNKVRQGKK